MARILFFDDLVQSVPLPVKARIAVEDFCVGDKTDEMQHIAVGIESRTVIEKSHMAVVAVGAFLQNCLYFRRVHPVAVRYVELSRSVKLFLAVG